MKLKVKDFQTDFQSKIKYQIVSILVRRESLSKLLVNLTSINILINSEIYNEQSFKKA